MTDAVFRKVVWEYYELHRRALPWRPPSASAAASWGARNAYNILVSEIMLQQTQADRVIPFYKNFLTQFPDWHSLARAPLTEILSAWKGLGYNRRARFLHQCAQSIVSTHNGSFPKHYKDILALPGIGTYTAGMLMNVIWNISHPIIETNIRTVYLFHFFTNKKNVSDKEILKKINTSIDTQRPREWQYALMDYGSYLKKKFNNTHATQSKHYKKQTSFIGSERQLRSAILHDLTQSSLTLSNIKKRYTMHPKIQSLEKILTSLQKEGMVVCNNNTYSISH